MKKAFILAFAALLACGSAQAQTKKAATKAAPKAAAVTLTNDAKKKTTVNPSEKAGKDEAARDIKKQNMEKRKFLNTRKLDPAMHEKGLDATLFKTLLMRKTDREFLEEELPEEMLSGLLWSAYGFNRTEEGKRVVPSACNSQEFDIYLFDREGIWLYDAEHDLLGMVEKGDHRGEISMQKHFLQAPVALVLVADYSRMEKIKDAADREFYAAADAGYISQNIYLYCAATNLGTVACGAINRENLNKLLNITNGKAILAHPVGHCQ